MTLYTWYIFSYNIYIREFADNHLIYALVDFVY